MSKNNIIMISIISIMLVSCSVVKEDQTGNSADANNDQLTTSSIIEHTQTIGEISGTVEVENQDGNPNCLGTFDDFAYTVVDDFHDYPDFGVVYPTPPWEFVDELNVDNDFSTGILATNEFDKKKELWIYNGNPRSNQKNQTREYIIYYPETAEQIIVKGAVGDEGVWVDRVYFDEDGNVWGRNMWNPADDYSYEEIPIVSKFNRDTQSFEFDKNAFNVPMVKNDASFIDWFSILLAPNKVIWFFVPYDGLYSYDTLSAKITRHKDIPDVTVAHEMITDDGIIYFMVWPDFEEGKRKIYQYLPSSDELSVYASVYLNTFGGAGMVMDHKNRLWLGPISRIDPDGTQQILHPDFDLYSQKISSAQGLYWDSPGISGEGSNGFLWFTKHRYTDTGSAWLDPETGEGCWYTTFTGGVVEDEDNKVWFLADKKLYKYDLKK